MFFPLVAGPFRRRLRALDAGVPPVLFERWRRWGAQVFLAVRPGALLLFPKQACVLDAPLPPQPGVVTVTLVGGESSQVLSHGCLLPQKQSPC